MARTRAWLLRMAFSRAVTVRALAAMSSDSRFDRRGSMAGEYAGQTVVSRGLDGHGKQSALSGPPGPASVGEHATDAEPWASKGCITSESLRG